MKKYKISFRLLHLQSFFDGHAVLRRLRLLINIQICRNVLSVDLIKTLRKVCGDCVLTLLLLGLEHEILINLVDGRYLACFSWLLLVVAMRLIITKLLNSVTRKVWLASE